MFRRFCVAQKADCGFCYLDFLNLPAIPFSERMIIMHYATLVTVEIESCMENETRTMEAQELIEKFTNFKRRNSEYDVMLDICTDELRMRSTVFSSRMADEVETIMVPFYCDTDHLDYLKFDDRKKEYRKAYETETVDLIRFPNGKILTSPQYAEYCKYEIAQGRLYEKNWGPLHHRKRTKMCKRIQLMEHVPYSEYYKSFDEFVEKEYGTPYCEEQKTYGYYYNPNAFYDWYAIGGHWPDMFLVKDDCKEYGIAYRSWSRAEMEAPDGYFWTCAARKKDIEWQVMYDWQLEQAIMRYARLSTAFFTGILGEMSSRITEEGIWILGKMVFQKGETEEEFLERYAFYKRKKYPINIYAFLADGIWNRAERVIPEDKNGRIERNAEWENELERFIDGLDDETVLVSVDCHM